MKKNLALLTFSVILASCSKPPVAPTPRVEAPEPNKATIWTDKAELYLEYPSLAVNLKSRFAVHLTRFSDFKALKEGSCEVRLAHAGGSEEIFPCDPSTHPGIFGANVQPKSAGEAHMSIHVSGRDLTEHFDVGTVKIAADAASVEPLTEAPKEETVSFLKEQQWVLDFGTQVVGEQNVRDSMRVAAETLPRTGGEASVIAPIGGRVNNEMNLRVGSPVTKGAALASIVPPTTAVSDLPTMQLAEAEAKASLDLALKDRQRVERLLTAGAIPARRLDEAKAAEITAQARLQASQTRLAQYDATRAAEGLETGTKRFLVRAPISGIISEANAISGANIEDGKVLYRIVDIDSLYVSGVVPESDLGRLKHLNGAEIEMPDGGDVRAAHQLVSVGKLVDPATRTVSVVYEVDNRDHQLAVNQTVFLRLLLAPSGKTPVVAESAIVDDGGRPIIFVQRSGETFARRPVKLGLRAGGMVQVLDGVKPAERVVTKGAYLIRLAALSSQIPAHGHVH